MHTTKRQKIGLALMVASVLVAILIQLLGGGLMEVHTLREERLPSGAVASEIALHFDWRYSIPLAVGFAIGLLCYAWPTRKPPRIVS